MLTMPRLLYAVGGISAAGSFGPSCRKFADCSVVNMRWIGAGSLQYGSGRGAVGPICQAKPGGSERPALAEQGAVESLCCP